MGDKFDKVIVTNKSALTAKYGTGGTAKVMAAVQALIAADQKRGLKSLLCLLDEDAAMSKLKAPAVKTASDPRQNKVALDAVYKAFAPDYLMLLGSIDVIPHQDLKNLMYAPSSDADKLAYGDLPYACEAKYSQKPQDFYGPTRVVSRLPDLTGAKDPAYLLNLLKVAQGYKKTDAQKYRDYFCISAEIWEDSTKLSITNTFGNTTYFKTVPPSKDNWEAPLLGKFSHFINCHGAPNNASFYGQPASGAQQYPTLFPYRCMSSGNY